MKKSFDKTKIVIIALLCLSIILVVSGVIIIKTSPFDSSQNNTSSGSATSSKSVSSELPDNVYPLKTTIEGVDIGAMTIDEAKNALSSVIAAKTTGYDITIKYNEQTWDLTEDTILPKTDVDNMLKTLMEEKHADNYLLTVSFDTDSISSKIEEIAKTIDVPAQNAKLVTYDLSTGAAQTTPAKDGLSVLQDTAIQSINQILNLGNKTSTVELKTKVTEAKTKIEDYSNKLSQISSFTTQSTANENSTFNMTRALQTVNGTIVQAGETFSFLGTVGACEQEDGYKESYAIGENNEYEIVYGGGICQASTTIYDAALKAGLEISQRFNHTIPSAYVDKGLDSTVSWPYTDLKFTNNTGAPIYIDSGANGLTMYCNIYGIKQDSWDEIKLSTQEKTNDDGSISVYATRTYIKNGTEVKTEDIPSSYYPPKNSD